MPREMASSSLPPVSTVSVRLPMTIAVPVSWHIGSTPPAATQALRSRSVATNRSLGDASGSSTIARSWARCAGRSRCWMSFTASRTSAVSVAGSISRNVRPAASTTVPGGSDRRRYSVSSGPSGSRSVWWKPGTSGIYHRSGGRTGPDRSDPPGKAPDCSDARDFDSACSPRLRQSVAGSPELLARFSRRMIPAARCGQHRSRQGTEQVEQPASADTDSEAGPPGLREQLDGLDRAVFRAIAATPTPSLDRAFGALSQAADHSVLWVATAALLAACGPSGQARRHRRLGGRRGDLSRDQPGAQAVGRSAQAESRPVTGVPATRQVEMPDSTSFPSGHSGSAFAFASAVANSWPPVAGPIHTLATLVAYSRVHTGVHYPGDVIVGSTVGSIVGPLSSYALRRWRRSRS